MPTLTFTAKYKIADGLAMGPAFFIAQYLHGLSLISPISGEVYPTEAIRHQIATSTTVIENMLHRKIVETTITEQTDWIEEEWKSWGSLKASFLINELIYVKGFVGNQEVFSPPIDGYVFLGREINFVPGTTVLASTIVGMAGNIVLMRGGLRVVPNWWHLQYKSGFKVIPLDVLKAIGKLSALQILAVLGDIQLGSPGISSESLSVDGLSQSVSQGGGSAFDARIKQYAEEIEKHDWPMLKDKYRGITFEVV